MKYIISDSVQTDSLEVGESGVTSICRIFGSAVFKENNSNTITITGIRILEIDVQPSARDEIVFAEVFVGDSRAEEYAILHPDYAKRWQAPYLSGGLTEHAVGGYKGDLFYRDLSDPNAKPVAQDTDAIDSNLHAYATRILVSDRDRMRVIKYNSQVVPPPWRVIGTGRQLPIAYGIARLEGDRRRQMVATSSGRIYWINHEDGDDGNLNLGFEFISAEFICDDKGEVTGLAACTPSGVLRVYDVDAGSKRVTEKFNDFSRRWYNAHPVPKTRSLIAIAAGGVGNIFNINVDTKVVSGILPTLHGVRGVSDTLGEGVVALDGGACILTSLTGDVLRTFSADVLPLQFVDPSVGTNCAYTTGTVVVIDGVEYPASSNTIAVHKVAGKNYAISYPRSTPLAYTVSSADLAPVINVVSKEVVDDTAILTVGVSGKDGVAYPISFAESTQAQAVYPSDLTKQVAHAVNGDTLQIRATVSTIKDNRIVFGVGRTAHVESVLPDTIPNPFRIPDIEGIAVGDYAHCLEFTPKGFDTPTPIKSNGEIWVNDAVVPNDTLINPGSRIRIRVQHGPHDVSAWWCDIGGVVAKFFSLTYAQRPTTQVAGRAYAPRSVVWSKPIKNTHADVALVFTLPTQLGRIKGLAQEERTAVLYPADSLTLEFEVVDFGHFAIPYRFGLSDHVWNVWADDRFLDKYPTTREASRHVEATSPQFEFTKIPSDFYMIARVPAGVLPVLDGEAVGAGLDARGYNSTSHEVELTSSSVLKYTAIPFSGGRDLDFGDVVARWVYPPKLADVTVDSDSVVVIPPRDSEVVADCIATAPPTMLTLPMPSRDCEIRMKAHQAVIQPHATYVAVYGVDGLAAPRAWGSDRYEPSARQIRFPSDFESRSAQAAQFKTTHEIGNVEFNSPRIQTVHAIANIEYELRYVTHMLSWYGEDYVYRALTRTYQPEAAGVHAVAASKAYLLNWVQPHSASLSIAYGNVLAALREQSPLNTVASEPALRTVNSKQAVPADLSPLPYKATSGESVVPKGPNELRVLGFYPLEVSSQEYLRPSLQGVPLRPTPHLVRLPDTADCYPKYFIPTRPISMLNIEANKADMRWLNYNSVMLSGRYEAHPVSTVALGAKNAARSVRKSAPLTALRVVSGSGYRVSTAGNVLPMSAVSRVMGATAHSIPAPERKDFEQKFARFIPKRAVDFEARKIVMEDEGRVHDGNVPSLLDRGYFSTELEALQNATQIWKMQPHEVAGRQLPNGMWYWIQLDFCYNMCKECPPYGYLSGG